MSNPFALLIDGSEMSLSPPGGEPPTLATIAHSLAGIKRFSGHTVREYSVLEHSLLCYEIALIEYPRLPRRFLRAVLLHDSAECVTGDMTSPVKRALGETWKRFEEAIEAFVWFGIHPRLAADMQEFEQQIKQCDLIALKLERRDLMNWGAPTNSNWTSIDGEQFRHSGRCLQISIPRTAPAEPAVKFQKRAFLAIARETYDGR